jgi:hypothetical protein
LANRRQSAVSSRESGIQGAFPGLEWKSELSGQASSKAHGEDGNALNVTELPAHTITELPDNTLP